MAPLVSISGNHNLIFILVFSNYISLFCCWYFLVTLIQLLKWLRSLGIPHWQGLKCCTLKQKIFQKVKQGMFNLSVAQKHFIRITFCFLLCWKSLNHHFYMSNLIYCPGLAFYCIWFLYWFWLQYFQLNVKPNWWNTTYGSTGTNTKKNRFASNLWQICSSFIWNIITSALKLIHLEFIHKINIFIFHLKYYHLCTGLDI